MPNAYPAKYGASGTTASCSDYIVFPTGQTGSSTAATIVAYNNLYTSCSNAVPSVAWAYNTGDRLLRLDFSDHLRGRLAGGLYPVHRERSSQLVLLKPSATSGGTVGAPATAPTNEGTIALYNGCTAPCMFTVSLSHYDGISSPFFDFGDDFAIYVGDSSGYLEMIAPVLNPSNTQRRRSPRPCSIPASRSLRPFLMPFRAASLPATRQGISTR